MTLASSRRSCGGPSISLALVPLALAVLVEVSGCAKVASGVAQSDADLGAAGFGDDAAVDEAARNNDDDAPPLSFDGPPPSVCGDGLLEFGESCDDGNTMSGDGCSSTCVVEPHYSCPTPGKPCVHDVICGDGILEGTEQCDDGNTKNGDGCSSTCSVECGWQCPPGAACRAAKCGDGIVAGKEQCDDGNTMDGDGCSSACTLESKPPSVPEGWVCTSSSAGGPDGGVADGGAADGGAVDGGATNCVGPTICTTTVCGNGKVEGSEQCDDGNDVSGDGCSPFCRLEPVCPPAGGPCSTVCGSGLLLPGDKKQCDDGNTVSGDGCSSTCMIEPGFTCTNVAVNPNPLILPIVYHDFQSWKDPSGHPDFEHYLGNGVAGMAQQSLGVSGVPVHAPTCVAWSSNLCAPPTNATPTWDPSVDWFGMWYVDSPTYNKTIVQTLTLPKIAGGAYQYSSTAFFPIDGMGWGNTPGQTHNFGFTSVTRYWFEYMGAATLAFFGDDDVFVYINKTLAVDLGGTHQRAQGSITLDATNGTGYSCDYAAPGITNAALGACDSTTQSGGGHVVNLGLAPGSVYEIAVFQAERHTTASNYQLTLGNFSGMKSVCVGACGDGIVTAPEQCDLGAAMNTGAYGGCNPDCTLAPYCGDKIIQPAYGEQCDSTPNCGPDCKLVIVQ
jgi:fibro-slime domain-containing protein